MKITVQEKIAELERRIVVLEDGQKKAAVPTTRTTTTTTTAPITEAQRSHSDRMWEHFDSVFVEMRKIFR